MVSLSLQKLDIFDHKTYVFGSVSKGTFEYQTCPVLECSLIYFRNAPLPIHILPSPRYFNPPTHPPCAVLGTGLKPVLSFSWRTRPLTFVPLCKLPKKRPNSKLHYVRGTWRNIRIWKKNICPKFQPWDWNSPMRFILLTAKSKRETNFGKKKW